MRMRCPARLNPVDLIGVIGTAEAVPFTKPGVLSRWEFFPKQVEPGPGKLRLDL